MIGTENLGGTMMGDCNHCSGSCEKCSGCGGCGGALELTEGEVAVLERLSQIPFLPAARKPDEMTPFYWKMNSIPKISTARSCSIWKKRD